MLLPVLLALLPLGAALAAEEPDDASAVPAAPVAADPQDEKRPGEDSPSTAESPPAAETPDFEKIPSRWYENPWSLLPQPAYEINEPGNKWNPFRQNKLKGDFPIIGDDIFLALTVTNFYLIEVRKLPTPRGNTGATPQNQAFFGDPDQKQQVYNLALSFDLFKGQQGFKPVDWRVKGTYVFNTVDLEVKEVGVVHSNPARGRRRQTHDIAFQELLVEKHLFDLSDRFDFLSLEAGLIPFRSDFRGFIFEDTNLGARISGNYDSNKWQYNLIAFSMREKDTNSDLNTWDDRDQQILIANVYRQDWPVLGYTTQVSYHFNRDEATTEFDLNENLVRPAPVGLAQPHEVRAHYLGWTGEGHIDRINVTHAFYYAFGRDSDNPFAARSVGIRAFFLAGEVSYDIDWLRLRTYAEFASGDRDPADGHAEGFDAILDAPGFAGGEFSFWTRQSPRLLGVNLTQRLSPLPDLQSSRFQGQSNFVNPGLFLAGAAADVELTPKSRFQLGGNFLRFHDSDPVESYLMIEEIDEIIGFEAFLGAQYRPFLNNHALIKVGPSIFWPGRAFEKIYDSERQLFSLFAEFVLTW
ncbi:MAG: hypothetical protein L0Z55_06195 [Planctomycetes bacterium]|nr:hypothetical protein [Planctomycetota bacterium]